TCSPLWKFLLGGGTGASPAVANGAVYIGSNSGFVAISAEGSGHLWVSGHNNLPQVSYPSAAVANGVVYVGGRDGLLYAFDANGCPEQFNQCSPLWTAATGNEIIASPSVANGVVYVGSSDGKVYAFDASGCGAPSCSPLWSAATGGPIRSSAAMVNG